MSFFSQQTQVLTQNFPLLGVFLVASFRSFYTADRTNPIQVGSAAVTGFDAAVCRLDSARNLAFIGDGFATVYCVDIADPFAPVILDSLAVGIGGDIVTACAIIGTTVFAINLASSEVYVIDASDPTNLVQIHEFVLTSVEGFVDQNGPVDIQVRGNDIYIINYDTASPPATPSLLSIIDVSDPVNPVQHGSLSWGVPVNDQVGTRQGSLELRGNRAYAVVAGELHIVDIQDPGNPRVVSDTSVAAQAFAFALNRDGTRALILQNPVGLTGCTLRLYSVTDAQHPSQLDTDAVARDLLSQVVLGPNNTFYVTSGDSLNQTILISVGIEGDTISQLFTSAGIGTAGGGAAIAARSTQSQEVALRV